MRRDSGSGGTLQMGHRFSLDVATALMKEVLWQGKQLLVEIGRTFKSTPQVCGASGVS